MKPPLDEQVPVNQFPKLKFADVAGFSNYEDERFE